MTASHSVIRFLLISDLHNVIFSPIRKDALLFKCQDPDVHISIESKFKGDDNYSGYDNLVCRVKCELPVDLNLAKFVQGLEAGYYIDVPGVPLRVPVCKDGEECIDASGQIQEGILVHLEHYPPALQDLCAQARKQLQEALERFIRLIRWKQNIDAPHSIIGEWSPSLYFCVDGPKYIVVTEPRNYWYGRPPRGIQWSSEHEAAIIDVWSIPNFKEPLGHELLREAAELCRSAPRSSLIMTSTALEVGVKNHISRVKPDTSWLLEKMPSPPIFRLLGDYLPSIHKANSSIKDWGALKHLWKTCQKIAEDRNQLVHSGQNPESNTLTGYINAVHDVLYILDVLDGHDWARNFVSQEVRAKQDWPDDPTPMANVTIISRATSPLDSPDPIFD
jgi:hypothetical protein